MNASGFNPLEAGAEMMRLWSEFAAKMMAAPMFPSGENSPPDAARQLRAGMFGAWTKAWEQLLRSPGFLEMLGQWTSATVKAREQFNEMMGQWQHEFQLATREDIDRLARSIQRVERRMADALDDLAGQIDELASRRDDRESLNGSPQPGDEEPAAAPRRRRSRPS